MRAWAAPFLVCVAARALDEVVPLRDTGYTIAHSNHLRIEISEVSCATKAACAVVLSAHGGVATMGLEKIDDAAWRFVAGTTNATIKAWKTTAVDLTVAEDAVTVSVGDGQKTVVLAGRPAGDAIALYGKSVAGVFLYSSRAHTVVHVRPDRYDGDTARVTSRGDAATGDDSTCGSGKTAVKDCDHPDLGSCGNACCVVERTVVAADLPAAADAIAYAAVKNFLAAGGGDGSYAYSNATDAAGHDPMDALPAGVPRNFTYVFQGTHATAGGYVDTLNFNIRKVDDHTAVLRAFSVSGIHGALGDGGQNYKNLMYLLRHFDIPASWVEPDIVAGCGK